MGVRSRRVSVCVAATGAAGGRAPRGRTRRLLLLLLPTLASAASKDRFVTSTGTQLVRVTSADNVETLSNSSGAVAVEWVAYKEGINDAPPSYTYKGLGYAPDVAAP